MTPDDDFSSTAADAGHAANSEPISPAHHAVSRGTTRRTFLERVVGSVAGASLLAMAPPSARAHALPGTEASWSKEEGSLRIGVGKSKVTPSLDMPLWGFAAREGPAQGVYLDLYVRAMTLNDGMNRAAIISGEFLYWRTELIERIRERLNQEHGLRPDQIILNATHTHSGPVLTQEAYADEIVEKTAALVGECLATETDARLYFGRGHSALGINRRGWTEDGYAQWRINPYGPVDHELIVLKAVDSGGIPIGVLMNYACHPTTTADYLFGGDFAGYAMTFVEAELDGGVAMFLQGTGGDIKPNHPREDDPLRFSYAGGPEKCAQFGRMISDATFRVLETPMHDVTGPIQTAKETVDLPLLERTIDETGDGPLAAPKRRAARLAALTLDAIDENGNYAEYRTSEVYLLRIGAEYVHVGLNGEVCVPFGLQIKGRLLPRPVMVTAYTGPSIGYVPGAGQIRGMGYEARVPYSPEAEDFLVAKVMEMVGPAA